MLNRALISLVLKVSGNVNADIGVGTRIPLKKIITWNHEVKPFVSARCIRTRCIRRCIREKLYEKGFSIDPLEMIGLPGREQLGDIGDPVKYVELLKKNDVDEELLREVLPQMKTIMLNNEYKHLKRHEIIYVDDQTIEDFYLNKEF